MPYILQRILVLPLLLLFLTAVVAYNFPPLTNRVIDQAQLLNPQQESELIAKLKDYEDKTTNQIVVVTINSLEGIAIEEYGVELGRYWGIGQKTKNNGVVLLIAPNERKMRIDVGYGLEGILTDAMCSIIIDRRLRPAFKTGDFAGGIKSGVEGIIAVLSSDIPPDLKKSASVGDFMGLIIPLLYLVFLFAVVIAPYIGAKNTLIPSLLISSVGGVVAGLITASIFLGLAAGGILFLLVYFRSKKGIDTWIASGGTSRFDGGFSGGGGSFGGGGASGSW